MWLGKRANPGNGRRDRRAWSGRDQEDQVRAIDGRKFMRSRGRDETSRHLQAIAPVFAGGADIEYHGAVRLSIPAPDLGGPCFPHVEVGKSIVEKLIHEVVVGAPLGIPFT